MYFLELPIVRVKQTAGIAEVTFGLDGHAFDFLPGQFVRIILPELTSPDPRGAARDFTISSLPNGKDILVVFRSGRAPSGFKKTLLSLPLGARVTISGPHGDMALPDSASRPLVFVAGGIGITAFAQKVRYALKQRKEQRMTLLWTASHEEALPFRSELQHLSRTHPNNVALVEKFGNRIDKKLLAQYVGDENDTKPLWQIAGAPEMVGGVCALLEELGIQKSDLQYEEYVGYGSLPKPIHVSSPLADTSDLDKAAHLNAPLFEGILEALNKTAIVSETDAEGTIVFVNDTFLEVSQYSRKELLGQNHRILKSSHHPPEFYRDLWHTISSGHIWRGEIKNRAKDGSYYWVDTSIAPIMDASGTPERYVSVRFVITDKKEAEEELATHRLNLQKLVEERTNELSTAHEKLKAHAAELSESDRKKDEFIAVLSHELRNPLSPAISSMELIELQGPEHPSTRNIAETAHTHLKTIARLLDDLLDVSRITQKKFKIRKEVLAVQTIVRRAVESVTPFAHNKQQRIDLRLGDEPIWIEADPVRLTQIFGNVLSNAVKYTAAGGVIEVRCASEGKAVVIRIKDNGIGIPHDMLSNIFEMFVQGKTATSAATTGGLGIGLSLTKRLVEMHDGTIEAFSKGEGAGSEFVIHLPISNALQFPIETSAPLWEMAPIRQFRILVVDDNEAAGMSLRDLLRHRGHTVALAHNWRDALTEVSNGYEVALLDIGMPEIDGYDLARRILREVDSPPALIALTGYGQEEDKRKAREAGFSLHLTKPIGLADIEKALMNIPRSSVIT